MAAVAAAASGGAGSSHALSCCLPRRTSSAAVVPYIPAALHTESQDDDARELSWFAYIYGKYIPFAVRWRFHLDPRPLQAAETESFEGCVAFVDISGFTQLSEWLIQTYGPSGPERLNSIISRYFDRLIKVIVSYGGDIIKFAGDAMLVVWRSPQKKPANANDVQPRGTRDRARSKILGDADEPLKLLVVRAVMCNLFLLEHFNNMPPAGVDEETGSSVRLQLHTGVGCGRIRAFFVGGENDMWEYFVAGDPIQQMADAGDEAKSGDVVLSSQAFELVAGLVSGRRLVSGNFRVDGMTDTFPFAATVPPQITPKLEEALTGFVPLAVKRHVDGDNPLSWIAQYRQVFVMFVVLPDVDYAVDDMLESLQAAVRTVQEAVFRFGGTVARLLADDKGTRFKVAFGMPSLQHDDDGVRVVKCALDVKHNLEAIGHSSQIGIATGMVFCGEAGSKQRCEYTAVGNKVIIAARLMQASSKNENRILCDEDTYLSAKAGIHFELLGRIKLKHVANKQPVYVPIHVRKPAAQTKPTMTVAVKRRNRRSERRTGPVSPRSSTTMTRRSVTMGGGGGGKRPSAGGPGVLSKSMRRRSISLRRIAQLAGREKEKQFVMDGLVEVLKTRELTVVLVESDGGMGKSALVSDVLTNMEMMGLDYLFGGGDGHESNTPFFPYRTVFEQLLNLTNMPRKERDNVMRHFLDGAHFPMAALLNPILGTGFQETRYSRKLGVDVRAEHTAHMLLDIVQKKVEESSPRVLVLEDMQYYDSASWALTYEICLTVPTVLLILTMRRPQRPYPPDYKKIRHLKCTRHITIEPLSEEDSGKLAANKLGVRQLPDALASAIFNKTTGHPLYVEELCQALIDQNVVTLVSGELKFDEVVVREGLSSVDAKGSVHSVINGRIDQLPDELRTTLQICAVIGQEVDVDVLRAVHPASFRRKEELLDDLLGLVEGGFMTPDEDATGEPSESLFAFKHSFYQEAAYNMLSFSRRKEIHRLVAEHLEAITEDDPDVANFGVLALHFLRGQEYQKALVWSEQAGLHAMGVNANREAVQYYTQMLDVMEHKIKDVAATDVAACKANLANALYLIGRYTECIGFFREALIVRHIEIPSQDRSVSTNFLKAGFRDHFKKRKERVAGEHKHTSDDDDDNQNNNATAAAAAASSLADDPDERSLDSEQRQDALDELVLLLERMIHASLACKRFSIAGYCAFHILTLGEESGEMALLTLGYSMCAYIALELGWRKLEERFWEQSESHVKQLIRSFPAPWITASIQFERARYHMAHGRLVVAYELFQKAKDIFYVEGDTKRWRECMMHRALCLFHLGHMHEALTAFHDVTVSAQKDVDMYFEANALYWKSMALLLTHGANDEIYRNLRASLSLCADLDSENKVPHAVLLTLNEYVRLCRHEPGAIEPEYKRLVELNLSDANLESWLSTRGRLWDVMAYFQFAMMFLDVIEFKVKELERLLAETQNDNSRSQSISGGGDPYDEDADEDEEKSEEKKEDKRSGRRKHSSAQRYRVGSTTSDEDDDDDDLDNDEETKAKKTKFSFDDVSPEPAMDAYNGLATSGSTYALFNAAASSAKLSLSSKKKSMGMLRKGFMSMRSMMNIQRPLLNRVTKLVRGLADFSDTYPYAQPFLLLVQARCEVVQRNFKDARKLLGRAKSVSAGAGFEYVRALSVYELGNVATSDKERVKHLQAFLSTANRIGLAYAFDPYFGAVRDAHAVVSAAAQERRRHEKKRKPSLLSTKKPSVFFSRRKAKTLRVRRSNATPRVQPQTGPWRNKHASVHTSDAFARSLTASRDAAVSRIGRRRSFSNAFEDVVARRVMLSHTHTPRTPSPRLRSPKLSGPRLEDDDDDDDEKETLEPGAVAMLAAATDTM